MISFSLAGIFIGTFSCISQKPDKDIDEEKIRVVVSILPQAEFVESVGGDKVEVTVIIPPGASPHTYELNPGQLEEISKAKIYITVGSGIGFELVWTSKIIEMKREMLIVDCSKGVELIEESHKNDEDFENEHGYDKEAEEVYKSKHNNIDPHIWLSLKNAKIMVENIYKGLIQIDSGNQNYYEKNKDNYLEELDRLDDEISQLLSKKKNRKIMVFHPAWAYFAKDYGILQISIEEEGKEPTPKGIENLINQAMEYDIKIIFASPEFSAQSAETIAREIGGSVALVSPLEKNYLENISKVARAFAQVLE